MEKTPIQLIVNERERQIKKKRYSRRHDDMHYEGELAMAAACYASPRKIYIKSDEEVNGVTFFDPWPFDDGDKRYCYGSGKDNPANELPDPSSMSTQERIDLLVKSGALIVAEIERLQRSTPNSGEKKEGV